MTTKTVRAASLSAAEMTAAYAAGDLTPCDVIDDTLELTREAAEQLNAVAFVDEDYARASADASAARWRAGAQLGELDGVPVSIKDSIPAVGTPWRHGSVVHDEIWATEDSAPAARIRESGAVIFAKTSMPDLGMVASGISSLYGVVRNPWNTDMTPGGSSSGAGALVAAGVGPLSVGTDLGGSVRAPAAHNGLFGMKPTQGLIPYAPASMVRSPGPLARTVDDMETLFSVLAVEDDSDLHGLPGRYAPADKFESVAGLRIGIVRDVGSGMATGDEEWAAVVRQATTLADGGAEVVELPDLGLRPEDQDAILATFRYRVLAELHSTPYSRWSSLLPELSDFVRLGYSDSGLAYAQSIQKLERAREAVRRITYEWDFVLTPVMSVAAFAAELPSPEGARSTIDHCQQTAWFNQTGQPAGVIPAGLTSQGMPVGVQIAGRRFADARVIALMRYLAERGESLNYPFLGDSAD